MLRAGVITEEQLRHALSEQKKWGGKLGSLLIEMNALDEDMLVKALSKQLGLPRIDFAGLQIPRQALEKLTADFAEGNQVLPISLDVSKNQLLVAMADPENLAITDEISFRTGCRVVVAIAGERALAHAIREHYFGDNVVDTGPDEEEEEGDFKLLNPLGSTMVRRMDEIKRKAQAEAQARAQGQAQAQPQAPAPPVAQAPGPGGTRSGFEDKLKRVEEIQQKEVRVLKAVVELLISKGYITREEYRQRMEQ
ncbi:MAG: hypothetical protein JXR96_18420 [Deltaproteobacteria bacterium]|nr:hypothetical protein [Deltaproteobacteria bacterium]